MFYKPYIHLTYPFKLKFTDNYLQPLFAVTCIKLILVSDIE